MTVHRSRRMYSGHRLSPWLSHVMASEEESARPLLTADETLRLPEDATLVFCAGHRPIYVKKLPYYQDARLLARARITAPEESDRLTSHCGISQKDPNHLSIGGTPLRLPTMTAPSEPNSRTTGRLGTAAAAESLNGPSDTEDLLK